MELKDLTYLHMLKQEISTMGAHSSRQHNYKDVIFLMHNSDIYAFKSVERNTSENMMCSKSEYNMLLYKGFSINISSMVTNSTK